MSLGLSSGGVSCDSALRFAREGGEANRPKLRSCPAERPGPVTPFGRGSRSPIDLRFAGAARGVCMTSLDRSHEVARRRALGRPELSSRTRRRLHVARLWAINLSVAAIDFWFAEAHFLAWLNSGDLRGLGVVMIETVVAVLIGVRREPIQTRVASSCGSPPRRHVGPMRRGQRRVAGRSARISSPWRCICPL